MHDAGAIFNEIARCLGRFFIDRINSAGFFLGFMIDHVWNRVARMRARNNRRGVVGQDHHFIVVILFERRQEDGEHLLVDQLNSAHFILRFVAVAALIRGFDVDIDKVLPAR